MQALQVSQTIMDEYSARILLGTFDHPVSALDISRRFAIPIAACYRRIKELEGLGLVYVEAALPSRNSKGLQLYRSRLRSVRIAFEDGKLRARVELGRDGVMPAENEVTEQVVNLREPSAGPPASSGAAPSGPRVWGRRRAPRCGRRGGALSRHGVA